ncbi:hypothetical protein MMC22_004862 [Lobaria immixta]|nr:hypothetical protein [Lobaria immixta]
MSSLPSSQLRYPRPALQRTLSIPPLPLSPREPAGKQSSGLNSLKRVRALSLVKLRSGDNERDAIADTVGLAHVVEGQDTPARIVALQIDEVDGHAAAKIALVREQGVEQGPDLRQCEVGTLREQTVTVRHYTAGSDAGDVLVVAVDCRGVFLRGKDGPVEVLGGEKRSAKMTAASTRATAVDAKGGGRDAKEIRDGEQAGDGAIHVLKFLEGIIGPKLVRVKPRDVRSFC